jgi:N-acetylglucosaminyl-diphospho-decaprenol L-rhamnosyltransferase
VRASGPAAVAVVVVSFNSRDTLGACLGSVAHHVGLPHEVVVVDNASTDGSAEAARESEPSLGVIRNPTNRGFARACNQGIRSTTAPRVLFLNPDAEITTGAVQALAAELDAAHDIGVVGPLTLEPDGAVQVSTGPDLTLSAERRQRRLVRGVRRREPGALSEAASRHAQPHEPDWVSGACLLARREALEAVGGFDERFFLYEEDADLCRRLRAAGWRVLFTPAATVHHRLGQSMAQAPRLARRAYHRSHLLYYRKHNSRLQEIALRVLLLGRALAGLDPELLSLALGRD